jgi:hypothetical protein
MSREESDRRKITPTGGMLLKWAARRNFTLVVFILESQRVFVTKRLEKGEAVLEGVSCCGSFRDFSCW